MRLFIAVDLPENIKNYLRDLQAELPHDAKFSKTHDFHLTLKFLGSCDGNRKKRVEDALKNIPFHNFKTRLTCIGTFGGRIPRVIWVGMEVPDWLKETAAEIENRMEKLGFEKENRFAPHITLARVKSIENPQSFLEAFRKITVDPLEFSVSRFYLFESLLSPKGATHVKLHEYP